MSKAYGLALLAIVLLGGASVLAIELSTRVRAPDGEQGATAAASARAPADAAPAVAASAPPAYAAPSAPYAAPSSPAPAAYPAVGALQYAPVPGTPGAFASGPDDADVEAERAERLAKRGRARRPRATASPE